MQQGRESEKVICLNVTVNAASKQTVPRLGVDQTELTDLLASPYCNDSLGSTFTSNKNAVIFIFTSEHRQK